MEHVYAGQLDACQGDAELKPRWFRPRYRALAVDGKGQHGYNLGHVLTRTMRAIIEPLNSDPEGARMPLSEYERQVLLFNLHVGVVPDEAPDMGMSEVVAMIQERFKAGDARMRVGERISEAEDEPEGEHTTGTDEPVNVISIRKMDVHQDGTVLMLLHHGDARAPDPALMQIETGSVRNAGKRADEGLAHAAHLIISTKHRSPSGQSRALLERVPNLGRSAVMAFLNRLLRDASASEHLEFEDHDTGRIKRFHPRLTGQQQLSHRLRADLQAGRLSRIEFITRHVAGGFEEPDRVVPTTQILVHKVVNAPTGRAALDLLERAKAFARRHHFEEMQIRFRKTDTDQHLSPRFATDIADAEDAVYSRHEVLTGFDRPLEQCPTDFCAELVGKMIALFGKRDLWRS